MGEDGGFDETSVYVLLSDELSAFSVAVIGSDRFLQSAKGKEDLGEGKREIRSSICKTGQVRGCFVDVCYERQTGTCRV